MLPMRPFDRTFGEMWNNFRTMERDFFDLFRRAGQATGDSSDTRLATGETTRASLPFWPGYPPVDAWTTEDDELVFRAELPGVDPDELDIQVVNDELVIRGERRFENETREKNYLLREVGSGRFERRFRLPEGTDTDKIDARYENGVLELTLPAAEKMRPKRIPVATSKSRKKIRAA